MKLLYFILLDITSNRKERIERIERIIIRAKKYNVVYGKC